MRFAKASCLLLLVCLLVLFLAGCGGWLGWIHGSGGGGGALKALSLTDSLGRKIGGTLPAGRVGFVNISNLPPNGTLEVIVKGPGKQIQVETGEIVSAYSSLPISDSGNISNSGVLPLLEDGTYDVTFRVSDKDGKVTTTGTQLITVGTVPGIPRIEACVAADLPDPSRAFDIGDDVFVKAKNLPANKQVDIYVVNGQMDLRQGTPLIDRSGWFQSMDTPVDNRGLRGTQETVTTGADGSIAPTGIWSDINAEAGDRRFEIIIDVDRDGVFDDGLDARQDQVVGGFVVRPGVQGSAEDKEVLITADINGNLRQNFAINERLYVVSPQGATVGKGFEAVRINVCANTDWADGDKITPWRTSYQTVCSEDMLFLPTCLMAPPP